MGNLWRPLRTSYSKSTLIIVSLAKLHNFIIDEGGMPHVPRPSGADCSGHQEPADNAILLQGQLDADNLLHRRRRDMETSRLRQVLTDSIEFHGLRP
jgi:hypothetical protein